MDTGGVDGGHVAQAQNHNRREGFEICRSFHELFGSPEEKRAVDAQKRDVGRDDAPLQHVGQPVADVVIAHRRDRCGLGNAINVEQGRQSQADGNGHSEIGKHREAEGDEPDRDGGKVQL